jgi:hypothetical protein
MLGGDRADRRCCCGGGVDADVSSAAAAPVVVVVRRSRRKDSNSIVYSTTDGRTATTADGTVIARHPPPPAAALFLLLLFARLLFANLHMPRGALGYFLLSIDIDRRQLFKNIYVAASPPTSFSHVGAEDEEGDDEQDKVRRENP